MKPVFLNAWKDCTAADVLSDFEASGYECEILFANYSREDYSGYAFVLFRKGGVLYEVNGSHCSCFGLEGQWEPEETTVQALLYRLDHGFIDGEFSDKLRTFLESLA